ncbi:pheromone A receptor-domain-containing protein [Mycena leptocephala]|nr:pheromone A receptor-domain-containing protein [Mycena leptocephala]
MVLASTDLLLTIPLTSFILYSNVAVIGLSPWVSWADMHSNFSRVVEAPGIYSVETLQWATVACALLFFAYFGFADEAIKNYREAFHYVARRVGYMTAGSLGLSSTGATSKSPLCSSHGATLPIFVLKDTTQKRDLFDSFSNMSASYRGISPLENDAEKVLAFGEDGAGREKGTLTLTLSDVSGMLPDYKASDYSSSPTSSSVLSDTETVHSAGEEIEVSFLHRECSRPHGVRVRICLEE